MKQLIFLELLNRLKGKPHLMRKIKIFAVVGIIGIVLSGTLLIWAGVSAIGYVAKKTNEVIQAPQTFAHVESLKAEVKGLGFQPANCWSKAQSLLAVEPWLQRQALDNLKNLKVACLETAPPICEGYECAQMKKRLKKAEG